MASVSMDTSELDQLAAELADAYSRAQPKIVATTTKAALNIKNGARNNIQGQITGRYLPHYPRSIDFDLSVSASGVDADIGPRSDMPQGGMGPGVEYGSSNAPPLPHLIPAFEDEVPTWMDFLADALAESVLP